MEINSAAYIVPINSLIILAMVMLSIPYLRRFLKPILGLNIVIVIAEFSLIALHTLT